MAASPRRVHSLAGLLLTLVASTSCAPPAPDHHFQKTMRIVRDNPDRFVFKLKRTHEALFIPASSEQLARVVYASYGVVMPPVPLIGESVLESAPVAVDDQQVVYRMRSSAERPSHIVLDAVVLMDAGSVVVHSAASGFGHRAWMPIEAVAGKLLPPDTLSGDRDSQWVPKGCPRSISSWSYCS